MTLIENQRYVSLSTWTKDGSQKRTPIWISLLDDGQVGFTTGKKTWKVRRIGRNPSVELQSCNRKGELTEGSKSYSGSARVVDSDEKEYKQVKNAIQKKYGIQYLLIRFFSQFSKKDLDHCAVVISLEKETLS